MYVKCISGSKFLKKDKIYKVDEVSNNFYFLTNIRRPSWYYKMNFIEINEYRDKKIEEILKIDKTRE